MPTAKENVAVRKKTPTAPAPSMPTWETLEEFVRTKIQMTMQSVLEEELTAFLGRRKSERRAGVDAAPGYRNGRGKRRKLALSCGTIELAVADEEVALHVAHHPLVLALGLRSRRPACPRPEPVLAGQVEEAPV